VNARGAAEAITFLAAVSGERLFPLWPLALATGNAAGGLCGLRWRDGDLVAGTPTISSTRVLPTSW